MSLTTNNDEQYALKIYPTTEGYAALDTNPLLRAAQIALDLSNLVRARKIPASNHLLLEPVLQIQTALDACRAEGTFSYLDGKEGNMVSLIQTYIDAINGKTSAVREIAYENMLDAIDKVSPLQQIKD